MAFGVHRTTVMRNVTIGALTLLVAGVAACATAPKSASEEKSLAANAEAMLVSMRAKDPGLQPLLDSAAGYVVFPSIGKGGFVVGGAHGRGVLYEQGRMTGFVSLTQASVGAQIGAQTFAELLVFADQGALGRLKAGTFQLGGNISAVALSAGVASSAQF